MKIYTEKPQILSAMVQNFVVQYCAPLAKEPSRLANLILSTYAIYICSCVSVSNFRLLFYIGQVQ